MRKILQRAHAELSNVSLGFLRFAQEEPKRALQIHYDETPLPGWLRPYLHAQQPWPTFIGSDWANRLHRISRGVVDLIRRIPERVFEGEARRLAEGYPGRSPALLDLLLSPPNGLDTSVARCDLIATTTGLKVLEVNLGAYLGGWEHHFLARACIDHPQMTAYLDRVGMTPFFRDPLVCLLEHVARDTLSRGLVDGAVLHLAVTTDPAHASFVEAAGQVLGEVLSQVVGTLDSSLEGRVTVCALPEGVESRRQQIFARGERVHAILEYSNVPTPPAVFRSFKAHQITLYNGPMAGVLTSKLSLAFLSEAQEDRDVWSDEQRQFIRDHIPWTRRVRDAETTFRGEALPLVRLLRERRENLVLKQANAARGEGVLIGASTSRETWEHTITESLHGESHWIVQERLTSRPYLYRLDEKTACPHDAIWGPFCFGNTYGGTYLRVMPQGRGDGIVNAARGATESPVFEVPR